MKYTFDEMVDRIANAMRKMEGDDLAELYNREFGNGLTYLGAEEFEQEDTEEEYEFLVMETRAVQCVYRVRAKNEEEAKAKAEEGDTIGETDLKTDCVVNRVVVENS